MKYLQLHELCIGSQKNCVAITIQIIIHIKSRFLRRKPNQIKSKQIYNVLTAMPMVLLALAS